MWKNKRRKRHVTTAPVKLISTKNSKHQIHLYAKFARAAIHVLEELTGLLGPGDVTFQSQNDNAKVSIGLKAVQSRPHC